MSTPVPPRGSPEPEYLEQGSGGPIGADRPARRSRRTALIAGGAVAGLLLISGGTWAALSFFGQGPQPAEALPVSTLGYAAVDIDPSGGQKIEAIQMLRQFPAFKDEIGLDTDDDIREKLFDEIGIEEQCDGVAYADDIEPWLGDRYAVAAIDLGEDQPTIAGVVQVKDAARAEDGLATLMECGGEDNAGWAIDGDWAVIAETDAIAKEIVEQSAKGSLADDSDYQHWIDEVGDAGVVNLYAAPAAGDYIADSFGDLFGLGMFGVPGSMDYPTSTADMAAPEVPEELRAAFEDFGGMAMTVRFDDGAVELEMAGDSKLTQTGLPVSEAGDDVLATLPEDTALAVGVGFAEGWFSDILDQTAGFTGGQMTVDELIAEAEAETGLELPEDAETLAGESAAFAISADIDAEALVNSDGPEGLPLGVKVQGDPESIEAVLEKIRTRIGTEADVLVTESDGDLIAIGADEDYVSELLEDGGLGDTDAFQNVVREAEDANAVFFLNFDAGDGWLVEVAGDDEQTAENLKPLEGLGVSSWIDGDAGHLLLRLTTN